MKSPKLKAEAKEKTNRIFFFIKGNTILKKSISLIRKDSFISLKLINIFFSFVKKTIIEKGNIKIQFISITVT